ncbi:MAG: hypothetical protein A2020_12860 [Lentisphaerae bacterium GWF2_45_14]|nr:MAG: hypothetical protein A2020_12860 [Lentisphaerae bacterium GWF2_45_14]
MRLLVTAGPTIEKIDPVRYISNFSSGKMGYAIAEAGREMNIDVTLISGPVSLPAPCGIKLIKVENASEMAAETKRIFPDSDITIMAAAVADYRPVLQAPQKMKKESVSLIIELEKTEDILASLGAMKKPGQVLVGFAAETENLLENAHAKLVRKNLDWIAANDVSGNETGFGSDLNAVTLISRNGTILEIPAAPKIEVARLILKEILSAS